MFSQVKFIKPQKMKLKEVRLEILNELRKQGREVTVEMAKPLATWKDKPKINFAIGLDKEAATLLVGPEGSEEQVNKFIWLDKGTKKRWALMSKDWSSKTKPNSFTASRGSGRVIIAGRKAMQKRGIGVRPGIKARGWTEALMKKRRKPFTRGIIDAKNKGVDKIY